MSDQTAFHAGTKSILEQARGQARSAAKAAMVEAYRRIGKRNVEEEQQGESQAQYGQRLLENISRELSASFGKGASLAARQSRIGKINHLHLSMVFYSYLPQCFVILDLKSGDLTHQDIGQMDIYVRKFDDLKRGEDDNPTLGIILCDGKDETIVR